MSSRQRQRLPHEPALDGLRGVAVAAVLLYHAGFRWMIGGYLGVSTFFTLSGFLIASLLVAEREQTGRIDLPAFWERRFRRIMPAAFLTLAGVAVFGCFAADSSQLERLRGDGFASLAYAVNWWFIATHRGYADIFASPSPVQHFWSLAIEEQFYLAFPLVTAGVFALSRGSRAALAGVLCALGITSVLLMLRLAASDVPTVRLYYGTDTRAAELLAGALLAVGLTRRQAIGPGWGRRCIATLGALGLAVSVFFWATLPNESSRLYQGGLAVYTAATTAILAAAVLPTGPVRALLSLPLLRWVGRISYGVYLFHFPVYLWLTPERTGLGSLPVLAGRVGLTLVLAHLSYRWLELPVRSGQLVRDWRRWALPPLAAMTCALALLAVTAGVPSATPTLPSAVAAGVLPRGGTLRVLVIGDSVARGIARALDRWGRASGQVAVMDITASGCGVAQGGVATARDAQRRAATCEAWFAGWRPVLEEFHPQVVLVYAGGWDLVDRQLPGWKSARGVGDQEYDRWLRARFEAVVELLSSRGTRVVWLTALCVRPGFIGSVGPFDPERVRLLNETILKPLAAARPDRMALVDLFTPVCPHGAFTNTLDGIEDLRPDGIHFSDAGADWIAGWLGPRLVREAALAPAARG